MVRNGNVTGYGGQLNVCRLYFTLYNLSQQSCHSVSPACLEKGGSRVLRIGEENLWTTYSLRDRGRGRERGERAGSGEEREHK